MQYQSTETPKQYIRIMKNEPMHVHVSGSRLKKPLMDGGIDDRAMLKTIETIHVSCEMFKIWETSPPHKPIVGVPLAKEFNESIAMDLNDLDGNLILHIIDHAACIIPSKRSKIGFSSIVCVGLTFLVHLIG